MYQQHLTRAEHLVLIRDQLSRDNPGWRDDLHLMYLPNSNPLNWLACDVETADGPATVTVWMRGGFEGERLSDAEAAELDWVGWMKQRAGS